ncbi:MAG: hypothetical protein PVI67_12700, partial [Anaerolineae bacterium]
STNQSTPLDKTHTARPSPAPLSAISSSVHYSILVSGLSAGELLPSGWSIRQALQRADGPGAAG